jgi:hypothetical protein
MPTTFSRTKAHLRSKRLLNRKKETEKKADVVDDAVVAVVEAEADDVVQAKLAAKRSVAAG